MGERISTQGEKTIALLPSCSMGNMLVEDTHVDEDSYQLQVRYMEEMAILLRDCEVPV